MTRLVVLVVFFGIILAAFGQAAPKVQQNLNPATRVDTICKQLGGGC